MGQKDWHFLGSYPGWFSLTSNSWFISVTNIVLMYDLPNPNEIITEPEEKQAWKRIVNKAVNEKWRRTIITQAELYSSLNRMSKQYTPWQCHQVLVPHENSTRDMNRIPVKMKILTWTYILQTNSVKFNNNEINPTCLLWHESDGDLQHFLIECKELSVTKRSHHEWYH